MPDKRSGFIAEKQKVVVSSGHGKNVDSSRFFALDFLRGLVRHVGAGAQGVAACLAAIGMLIFCLYIRRRFAAFEKEVAK